MPLSARLVLAAVLATASPLAHAESRSFRLWGGGGYGSSAIADGRVGGGQAIAGIRFPSLSHERQSVRASASRFFDRSDFDRYSLLVHVGYRFLGPLEAAFLGGVGYLDRKRGPGTYLKPVVGLELASVLADRGASTVSAYAAYQVFRGSTGTLALDGGTDALTTRTFSVGLVVSFALFTDSAAN